MREPLKDRLRLEHIRDAINNIAQFMNGKSRQDLDADTMLFFAVVKNIEIIGEAAYQLTKAFRDQHPDVEWDGITRMRHVLVHDYFRISVNEVWKVVQDDLQPLLAQVVDYIEKTDWNEWEKNGVVIAETAVHKNIIQTAKRMKRDGLSATQISRYTGLSPDEIDTL